MQECTYATTTCTGSAVNHFFVFIWWAILINQIKILLTLHLTQHVCCFSDDWGTQDSRFCLDDSFGFSRAEVVRRHQARIMPRADSAWGAAPAGWGGRVGAPKGAGSPKRLALALCFLQAQSRETKEGGKTALLRPHLNAVSLKAFFHSSEGTGPNHGSSPHNLVLGWAVNSLCLEKSVSKVSVCWTYTVMVMWSCSRII